MTVITNIRHTPHAHTVTRPHTHECMHARTDARTHTSTSFLPPIHHGHHSSSPPSPLLRLLLLSCQRLFFLSLFHSPTPTFLHSYSPHLSSLNSFPSSPPFSILYSLFPCYQSSILSFSSFILSFSIYPFSILLLPPSVALSPSPHLSS